MTEPCFDWDTCPECHGIGSDENMPFWCHTCHATGSVPARRNHYEVISPEMISYHQSWDPPEPPDHYCAWGVFVAHTAREAKVLAIHDPEFADWVRDARGDGVPPFKGLKVRLARCEHGVCWACNGDEESSGCPTCDAAFAERPCHCGRMRADECTMSLTGVCR